MVATDGSHACLFTDVPSVKAMPGCLPSIVYLKASLATSSLGSSRHCAHAAAQSSCREGTSGPPQKASAAYCPGLTESAVTISSAQESELRRDRLNYAASATSPPHADAYARTTLVAPWNRRAPPVSLSLLLSSVRSPAQRGQREAARRLLWRGVSRWRSRAGTIRSPPHALRA